jgi:hypothetical protein
MEFPPEILSIIREYSAPCFKYFREYKRILRVKSIPEWTALRESLWTRPDEVIDAMCLFEHAKKAFDSSRQRYTYITWYSKEYEEDFYQKRRLLLQTEQQLYTVVYKMDNYI